MIHGTLCFTDFIFILCLAALFDLTLGEPPSKLHPTVWMGKIISFLTSRMGHQHPRIEKVNGILLGLISISLFSIPTYFILEWVASYYGRIPHIIIAAILLKPTFAIRCMREYTLPIAEAVAQGNLEKAKDFMPYIVRRDPTGLGEEHVLSSAVESIAEGTVDGITSPIFFFLFFGVPGAVAYRVINTLDSMVGYKDPKHINLGWFSARLDDIANYIPVRLTALLMIVAGFVLRENWKTAWKTLWRDKNKTTSVNAGWTMSVMAGNLNVRLEKIGHYVLGEEKEPLAPKHVSQALRVMNLTVFLFALFIVAVLLLIMHGASAIPGGLTMSINGGGNIR